MNKYITALAYLQRDMHMDKAYLKLIQPILRQDEVQEMRKYMHHGYIDCLNHSLQVSYMAYRIGRKFNMDSAALARAGLLHDFYLYDWHIKGGHEGRHGFRHAGIALSNARKYFDLSEVEEDIIKWHMWPLNIGFPKFKESWIMMFADRYCTLLEYLRIAPLQPKLF